jgi:hypothetical protein
MVARPHGDLVTTIRPNPSSRSLTTIIINIVVLPAVILIVVAYFFFITITKSSIVAGVDTAIFVIIVVVVVIVTVGDVTPIINFWECSIKAAKNIPMEYDLEAPTSIAPCGNNRPRLRGWDPPTSTATSRLVPKQEFGETLTSTSKKYSHDRARWEEQNARTPTW